MPGGGVTHPPALPAPLYQGAANTWECDEGGHLNVRFQIERAMAGLALLSAALDMRSANGGAVLLPLELHARFLKEARPGAGLIMHGGVIEIDEHEAIVCLDMRHADGAPASTFRFRVAHVEPRVLKTFPWSTRAREAAKRLTCALPDHAKPRSIDLSQAPGEVSLARAIALGAARIGAHAVTPDQCDAFGRLRAEHVFGRVSDSIPTMLAQWRREIADAASTVAPVEPAGAVVEARIVFRRWPRAGDLIEVRSGVSEVAEKTNRFIHWLLDPVSGAAWASLEAVALTFDIATRKAIAPSAAARKTMAARAIPEMRV